MRLHPPEFTAEPEDPFANDRLRRRSQVEGFCRMLLGVDGHAVVSLDGAWGSGKTAFARMCAAYLRSEEAQEIRRARVVEFNAWRQGHTGSPLLDLVSAISSEVEDETKKALATAVAKLGAQLATHAVRAVTSGLVDLGALTIQESEDMRTAWEEAEQGTTHFKEQLEMAAAGSDGPLVVLVDELDRCQPTYALELLATARHLFDVDGVVVVLAINRTELVHSVQSIYGPHFSADRFLCRFADLHSQLLPPSEPELTPFFQQLLEETDLLSHAGAEIRKMLWLVGVADGCGLRDIQQATYHYGAVLATFSHVKDRSTLEGIRMASAALIVFRALDRDAYQGIATGQFDGFQAITAARKLLTPNGASRPSVTDEDLCWMEAILFGFASVTRRAHDSDWPLPREEEEFAQRYQAATGSEGGDPAAVFRKHELWSRKTTWLYSPDSAKTITSPIDMLSSG